MLFAVSKPQPIGGYPPTGRWPVIFLQRRVPTGKHSSNFSARQAPAAGELALDLIYISSDDGIR